MRTLIYLNKGKEKAGSWKELAEALGMPQTHMSNIKNGTGGRHLSEKQALMLANFLDIDVGEILKARAYDLAGSDEERQLWLPFLSKAACVIVLAGAHFVSPTPAKAAPSLEKPVGEFLLCKVARALRKAKRALRQVLRQTQQPLITPQIC